MAQKTLSYTFGSGRIYQPGKGIGFSALYYDDGVTLVCAEDYEKSGWKRRKLSGGSSNWGHFKCGTCAYNRISATRHYRRSIYGSVRKHMHCGTGKCDAVGASFPFV